ncbi:autotransporter outer membrane beta-barrel domain-containing protein [Ralstonia sp. UBA689]|uniref:autotransporter family protein n=1 Tax=Ralstonia sp. UBA689 TaxID=1947373 RepID=UPI0025EDFAFB|nr:autotransporter outer membrane beta-barrel domain-containing protein [Ralstonia sp. UBA689]
MIVRTGSTLRVGDTSAIAVRDNARITVQSGATVSASATTTDGFYGLGGNTIDFRNNSTLTVQRGGQVLATGTQDVAEALNPLGTGNTIINDGLIRSASTSAIWFETETGTNTIFNNATGVIQTDVANGHAIGAETDGSIHFTNRGKVVGAVYFANRDDALHLYTGSSISGSITGGDGANLITLNGTGNATLGIVSDFQTLQKQDSGTWTLPENLVIMGVTSAKVQQGTLILQDNNGEYTGTMQVDAGATLQGDALSVTKAVTNNGLVRFQQDVDGRYTGQIVGAGAVEKTGTGTLTLGAGNTHGGGTTITQGTLAINADSALGDTSGALTLNGGTLQLASNVDVAATRAISIAEGGGTIDTQGYTSTVAQRMTGAGSLTKAGNGTLVLAADNAYQRDTTIAAGTLQLGKGGTSGSVASNVTNNGMLVFNRSDVFTFGGAISGTGGITQAGTGTTVLTANNAIQGDALVASGALAIGDAAHADAALGVSGTHAPQSLRTMAAGSGGNVQIAANASLGGYGTVNGAVTNSGTVAVADALAAFATGGSGSLTINGSLNNAGMVQIGGAGVGNKLVVNGNYVGNGGVLAINTQLGADNSPTDKLVISGGTASGNTAVHVTNAGGAGAKTTGDGIEVVSAINGATTQANAFALAHRVVAGPYEYTLQRGGSASADSWYLRALQTATQATGTDITDTGTTQPALRPEVSLYTAIPSLTLLYGRTLLDTLHERVGEESNQATGPAGTSPVLRTGWARVIAQKGSRMSDGNGIYGNQGPAFSYDFGGVQVGADVYQRQREDGSRDHAGGYFAAGRIAADVTHADGADAGRDTVNANTVGLYWTHFGPSGWYLDGVVQGTRYDADASPHGVNGLKTHALSYAASLEAGYPIALSPQWRVEPQAQIVYQRAAFADANDGAADVHFNSVNSMLGRLGVRVSKRWGESPERQHTAWVHANVWHEFRGQTGTQMSSPDGGFVPFTSQLPSTTLELMGGLTAQVAKNGVFYASLGYQISADRRLHGVNGKAGVRWGW